MTSVNVRCFECGKEFLRPLRRYNEAIKRGWKQFCSHECRDKNNRKGQNLICNNPFCKKRFYRSQSEIDKTVRSFCSNHCRALIQNLEKGLRNQKRCSNPSCSQIILSHKLYCSNKCQQSVQKISVKEYQQYTVKNIKKFVQDHERIPLKRELSYLYRPARIAFGTWNKAIKAAGFKPNKLKFTKKYIANDGHICDSFSEKIIDDWLFARKIKHKINVSYSDENSFTADFKVKDYWIEFFGLSGQNKRYDQLKKQKIAMIKKNNLKLIQIYPKDLFPQSKLSKKLKALSY